MNILEHEFVETNGVTLHVVQQGPEDGECVILLHGFPEFWYGWHKQISRLADQGYRVWAPDQRGYNLSDKPKRINDYKIDELVQDIVGLIKASEKERIILAGHDWGGIVAWHVARKHPELIKKLIIINAPHEGAMIDHIRRQPTQLLRSSYIPFFMLRRTLNTFLHLSDWKPFTKTIQYSSQKGTFTDEDFQHYRQAWSQPHAMQSMLKWYRANGRQFAQPQLPERVTVPTLVLWGAKDQFLDWELAGKSLEFCDDGKAILIGEGTHWVHLEEPELVSKLMGDFIDEPSA